MGTDFFFRMGHSHTVCQDYALAGKHGGIQFACLSDGCSGIHKPEILGSPNTDFGARFLVRAAIESLESMAAGVFPAETLIRRAQHMAEIAGLGLEALDATLLVAIKTPEGVKVYQTGDGVVAARRKSGEIQYYSRQFEGNAPYYLSYILHNREAYEKTVFYVKEHEGNINSEGFWSPRVYTYNISMVREYFFPKEEFDIVLLMSDGAESFQRADKTSVAVQDVVDQMFAFKGLLGEFIGRRCNRFFSKFCVENGWRHYDDFSVAGIVLI